MSDLARSDIRSIPAAKSSVGRVPPSDLVAERNLLGAMMLSKEAISATATLLRTDDFYKPAHAHVFDAILSLDSAGEPADPVTVADELGRAGVLESIGGRGLLAEIVTTAPAVSNAPRYAKIIADHAILRRLIGIGGDIAEIGYDLPDDVEGAVDAAESLVYELGQRRVTDSMVPMKDLLSTTLDRLEALVERGDAITGLPTGFVDLDRLLSGLQPSTLNIVGARPAMGKTSFALNLTANAAFQSRRPVLFFSLEMGNLELTQRLLCAEAQIDSTKVRDGRLADAEWDRIALGVSRLAEAELYLDDNPNVSVAEIRAKARRLKSQLGDLSMVVIDYLQLMQGRRSAESRQIEVSEMSRGLKILARELECPVIALSQLSRTLESRTDKRPMLSDLRESGCLTRDMRLFRADSGEPVTFGELLDGGMRDVPVWATDEDGHLVSANLTHAFPSGTKPTYRVTLRSGTVVEATGNHPFRVLDGWAPLDELSVGSRVATARQLPAPAEPTPMDPDEILLLAHLIGEGSQQSLPAAVFGLPDDQIRLFLHHLFATDGSLSSRVPEGQTRLTHLYYSTSSERLAQDLRLLLLRVEVLARVRTVPQRSGRDGYMVDISGSAQQHRFLTEVGIHGEHGLQIPEIVTDLAEVRSNTNVDTVPREIRQSMKETRMAVGMTERELQAAVGTQYCGSSFDKTCPSRPRLAQVASMDDARLGAAASDLFWDEITSIEPIGDREVFDATVDGVHNFVCEGLVLHNSLEQDADVVMFLYRDEVYNAESPDRGMAEVIISKHRNGPTGKVSLAFRNHLTRFDNMAQL